MSSRLFPGRRVMWLPLDLPWRAPAAGTGCCAEMAAALDHDCREHGDPFACPDALVIHHAPFGEWGLIVHDGGPSYVLISRCPWCGADLGASRRDDWFDTLEAMGINAPNAGNVPPEFLTADWRRKAMPSAPKEM